MSERDLQSKILQRFYNSCTPEEQKWITRIILKGIPLTDVVEGLRFIHLRRHANIGEGEYRILCISSRRELSCKCPGIYG